MLSAVIGILSVYIERQYPKTYRNSSINAHRGVLIVCKHFRRGGEAQKVNKISLEWLSISFIHLPHTREERQFSVLTIVVNVSQY